MVFEETPQLSAGIPKVVQGTVKTVSISRQKMLTLYYYICYKMVNISFQTKDSQQVIIGRKKLIVTEQKPVTQRIVVSSKPAQEEVCIVIGNFHESLSSKETGKRVKS